MSRILYAVLDWGLGHATRSSVLIEELILQDCEVEIYTAGSAKIYLQRRFPDLVFHSAPTLNIRNGALAFISWPCLLLGQYIKDRLWCRRSAHHYDRIISDGRIGIRSSETPSALINHQIQIAVYSFPLASLWSRIARGLSAKYHQLWIPDYSDDTTALAGPLSRTSQTHARFLGPISSWKDLDISVKKDIDVLVILSGIEPARTHLQDRLIELLSSMTDIRWELVSGRDDLAGPHHGMLSHEDISSLAARSRMVIARSGYSTIMDLHLSRIPGILLPTPGQPEQEYLARHLPVGLFTCSDDSLTEELIRTALSSHDQRKNMQRTNGWSNTVKEFIS